MGIRLGAAGRRRFDRGDSSCAGTWSELDWYGRGIWNGPLGKDCRPGLETVAKEAAVRLYEVRAALGRKPQGLPGSFGSFDSQGMRRQLAALRDRRHRPLPDALAAARQRPRLGRSLASDE